MIAPVSAITAGVSSALAGSVTGAQGAFAAQPGFAGTLDQALQAVSTAQAQATSAEAGFAAGAPGATLSKALVASDRAAVAWNATVAVRNELVSAYQSVMNMQF